MIVFRYHKANKTVLDFSLGLGKFRVGYQYR